jgi:hypothetical protein
VRDLVRVVIDRMDPEGGGVAPAIDVQQVEDGDAEALGRPPDEGVDRGEWVVRVELPQAPGRSRAPA